MYKLIALILLILSFIFVISCGLSEDTVAKVGSKEIKVDEFKAQLKQRFPNKESFTDVDSAGKMQVLNRMIMNQTRLSAAYDMNLDEDEEVLNAVNSQKKRMIYSKYYERMIVDSLIDLSKVEEHLEKIKEEVKASHVLIGFEGARSGKSTRSKEEAEKLALKIAEQAKSGTAFSKLALDNSDDPSAKSNKGDLGFFTWGRMTDAFQQTAFNLNPGEISDPVLSEFGYHIIRVEDRRPNPNYDPENLAEPTLQIKRRLYSENKDEATKMWIEHSKKLKEEKGFQVLKENIAQVIVITNEKRDAGKSKSTDYTDEEKGIELAKWNGGSVTLGDLFKVYARDFNRLHSKLTDQASIEKETENFGTQEMVVQIAENMGLAKEKDVKDAIDKLLEQRMLSLIDKKAITDKIEIDDEELKTYYEEHKKDYANPAEIEIWEIYVTDEILANRIANLAIGGSDFEKLAEKHSEDKVNKKKKGYLGFKSEKRRGAVSKKAFEIGENQIAGPIKYRNGFAVIKTGQLKPETIKSFEDASSRVRSKIRGIKMKDRRKEFEDEIKNRYSVKINYELLEKI